ncbi:unnamed protein product, partial [Polarella glacialis]
GGFMGSYPVPIKSPSVLEAKVHPLVFQCYKSFWVFATGWLFVLANGTSYEFSWWGVASAAFWVPAGLSTIISVPRIGLAMTMVVSCGSSTILSFLVFWLFLGDRMQQHSILGHEVYLAP